MATSNRFLDYLASGKNIAGVAGGAVGLGLGAAGLGGPYWPLFVVALYAAGALVVPRRKVNLVIESAEGQVGELRAELKTLNQTVDQQRARLPPPAIEAVRRSSEMLTDVLARVDVLTSFPDHLHTANRVIRIDLPTSIQTYLNLPLLRTAGRRMRGRSGPGDELVRQLTLIENHVEKLVEDVFELDRQRLEDHGRYLDLLSGDNELDNPAE